MSDNLRLWANRLEALPLSLLLSLQQEQNPSLWNQQNYRGRQRVYHRYCKRLYHGHFQEQLFQNPR